jgi:hypothetical protein
MPIKRSDQLKAEWGARAAEHLVGRRVVQVRYMTDKECEAMDWDEAALVIVFDDNSFIAAMRDDEGNGAGAYFTSWDDLDAIPVI